MLDTSRIHENLHQGSFPPPGNDVAAAGFDVLVLAASEAQPRAGDYPGVRVIHAPFEDEPLESYGYGSAPPDGLLTAKSAADKVAACLQDGKRVLVTCMAGRNRSGLVCGLALHQIHGWSGEHIVNSIQQARPQALSNASFAAALRRLPSLAPVMRR
jgi:protein-tyrosine phosphatase